MGVEHQRRSWTDPHPYRVLEARVREWAAPGATVLDVGCGRAAERLRQLCPSGGRGVGVDVDAFTSAARHDVRLTLYEVGTAGGWGVPSASCNVAYSVSVVEHLADPALVFREVARVLKKGAPCAILTPNLWDYASLAARMIPNRWHGAIVKATEGRAEADTFPTYYRANTKRRLCAVVASAGLDVTRCVYLNTPPTYLAFHPWAWRAGCYYHRAIARVPALRPLQGWLYVEARRSC